MREIVEDIEVTLLGPTAFKFNKNQNDGMGWEEEKRERTNGSKEKPA